MFGARIVPAICAAALLTAQPIAGPRGTHTENGLAGFAKILCSGVFVSGRAPEDVVAGSAYFFMPEAERDQVKWTIDRTAKLARASFGPTTREARFYGDQGCIIQNPDAPGIHFTPVAVRTRLPAADTQASVNFCRAPLVLPIKNLWERSPVVNWSKGPSTC
jgi:hypothetical protein